MALLTQMMMAQLHQQRLTSVQNLLETDLDDEDAEDVDDDEEECRKKKIQVSDPELALFFEKFTALRTSRATKPSASDQRVRPWKPESNACNDNDARRIQRVPSNTKTVWLPSKTNRVTLWIVYVPRTPDHASNVIEYGKCRRNLHCSIYWQMNLAEAWLDEVLASWQTIRRKDQTSRERYPSLNPKTDKDRERDLWLFKALKTSAKPYVYRWSESHRAKKRDGWRNLRLVISIAKKHTNCGLHSWI